MPNYIRRRVSGGTYFFTVNLADPRNCTLAMEIDLLRQCYAATCRETPFRTDTIVILPNHLHVIWKLPDGDSDFLSRWRRLKGRFTHALREKHTAEFGDQRGQVPAVWQPRFWEHLIRDTDDLDQHRAYCWTDPVRHGLVHDPMDWPFSSFNKRDQRFAEDGTVAFPDMKFPTGEFECAPPSGGRVSRPTKADAA